MSGDEKLPWEEWRIQCAQHLLSRVPGEDGWDWTETVDWQEMRENYYEDDYTSPEGAAEEELYALANS